MTYSDEALQDIREYLQVQGLAWANEYIEGRAKFLKSRGINATSELINSLQAEVLQTLEEAGLVRIQIAFSPSGRFIDLKRQRPPNGGDNYIKALEQWIEDKGLREKWAKRFIERRGLKTLPPSYLNQMAWGLAKSRVKKYRRRAWYAKSSAGSINDLYNLVAAGLPEKVAAAIKRNFKNQ